MPVPATRSGSRLERGVPLVEAIYAVVKAGAAYVPLDATLPDARLAYMIRQSAPIKVSTDPTCRAGIPDGDWRVVLMLSRSRSRGPASRRRTQTPAAPPPTCHHFLHLRVHGPAKGVAYPIYGARPAWTGCSGSTPSGWWAPPSETSAGFTSLIWRSSGRCGTVPGWWCAGPTATATRGTWRGRLVRGAPHQHALLVRDHDGAVRGARGRRGATALRWALCGGEPLTPRVRDRFYVDAARHDPGGASAGRPRPAPSSTCP